MSIPILLAHGALGNWDEVIFLSIGVIFLFMMGISWVRSRNIRPNFDDSETTDAPETTHFPME